MQPTNSSFYTPPSSTPGRRSISVSSQSRLAHLRRVGVLAEAHDPAALDVVDVGESGGRGLARRLVGAAILSEGDDRLAGVQPLVDDGLPIHPVRRELREDALEHRVCSDVPAAAGEAFALDP